MEQITQEKNIRFTVAYDGTDFYGFQSQRRNGLPTIQETLEEALSKLTGEKIAVIGSGRTDAGVHAWGQVVNFKTRSTVPPDKYPLALRPLLPESIVIRESCEVPPDFHAQYGAVDKTYLYHFYCHRQMSPFFRRYAYHVPQPLDIEAMKQAAGYFVGVHDFRAFCQAGTPVKSFVREIFECCLLQEEGSPIFGLKAMGQLEQVPLLTLKVRGSGFLWNMVRIMAGTILYVGLGKIKAQDIPAIIGFGDRTLAGKTLPPQGLFLYKVNYDKSAEEK